MSRRMDMIASMVFCFQLFLTMKDTQGERLVRLSATQESSAICSTAFLVGQIFSLSWQELPVPRPERYATSHPKKNKRMVRFVL